MKKRNENLFKFPKLFYILPPILFIVGILITILLYFCGINVIEILQ